MYNLLSFAFSITGPVLLLLSIGWFVRHIGMIGDTFIREANTLVYNIAFPVMLFYACLLYTSPSPRDGLLSRMPSSA